MSRIHETPGTLAKGHEDRFDIVFVRKDDYQSASVFYWKDRAHVNRLTVTEVKNFIAHGTARDTARPRRGKGKGMTGTGMLAAGAALLLGTTGCFTAHPEKLLAAIAKDPAAVHIQGSGAWGTVKIYRANPGPNSIAVGGNAGITTKP